MTETDGEHGENWHALEPEAVAARLKAGGEAGLSSVEAARRLSEHGANEIDAAEPFLPFAALVRQFADPLVLILLVAAGISWAVGEVVDAAAITFIVAANGILGFVQEQRAEQALAELSAMMTPTARVIRDGGRVEIAARDVVPGDIVELRVGDQVPADVKLIDTADFKIDESVLTGEARPVSKRVGADAASASLAERASVAHAGTIVATGRGVGVACRTGAAAEFGRIATLASEVRRAATPLQRRLGRLGRTLGAAAIGVAAFVSLVGIATGRPALEMFLTGVSLAVAAVPEGLPAVVALSLALGVRAMARRNALVRRLRAVETLGSATVICTDKTGTLTTGSMATVRLMTASGALEIPFRATGATDAEAVAALETAAICNDAGFDAEDRATGSPTEAALLAAARTAGVEAARAARRIRETPFSSERKMMTVVVARGERLEAHVKGAPERVIGKCARLLVDADELPLDDAAREDWIRRAANMAAHGLRVIALARRTEGVDGEAEDALTLLGLAGLRDPPRERAREAVEIARAAGVHVIMITGDAPDTARAIASDVGLDAGEVILGRDIDALDDASLTARLRASAVLSRTTPEHKLRVIALLQAAGEIVAMTGDGVNDAPALKKADIGVAMGVRGTDAAKAAADMVLLDDDFSTIVEAMREGRRQDDNIRKFVRFLIAANFGEALAVAGNILIGAPLILQPAQILWMNLVTDGAPALALGFERAEPRVMDRPPRPPDAPVLSREMLRDIAVYGSVLAVAAIAIFHSVADLGLAVAQTSAFTTLVVLQQGVVLNFRASAASLSQIGWTSNPWLLWAIAASIALQLAAVYLWPLTVALGTAPLPAWTWLACLVGAMAIVGTSEAVQSIRAARRSAVA